MQPAFNHCQREPKHKWVAKQFTFGESLPIAVEQQGGHRIPPSGGKPTMAPPTVNMGLPLGKDEPMGVCQECSSYPKKNPAPRWCAEECNDDGLFFAWANQWFSKEQLELRVPHACCCQCVISSLWPDRMNQEGRRHGRKCSGHCSHHPATGAQSSTGAFVPRRTSNFPVRPHLVGTITGMLKITTTTAEDVSMTELSNGITAMAIDI